ncbi:lipopolysaccharide biosynthesis protein [Aureimonas sp. AU4]|uniref:lipopolysaccharide biosynthesis protein n=1 Tax=Aureimonas sp. AU4 TaxID=1638163 RepID=UPI00078243B8|nr:lipopolysaccharide biosynthesis protein [Aureimonas sp. AU4]
MRRIDVVTEPVEQVPLLAGHSQQRIMSGLLWSFAQGWGSRILTFVIFLVLARLLTPQAIGLAATVSLILLVLGFIAEFGYGDAMVQRAQLDPTDITLPFATSIFLSVTLAIAMAVLADRIEIWTDAPGLGPLLPVAALILPLTTMSMFQEALYRRAFDYRSLALRMLTATALSGVVGISAAFLGLGALSLVLQSLVLVAVSAVWLWCRPKWKPVREVNTASWRQLTRYSVHVLSNRLVDFGTTRSIEIIILSLYGTAALGLYAVGSRVYQTAIQVLATSVGDISLSTISRFSDDRARVRAAYLKTIALSGTVTSPLFVGAAALAPELTHLLFGERWTTSAYVMQPLMLLGAVQTIQFINGAYFSALGRPVFGVALNTLKALVVVPALLLFRTFDITGLAVVFALAQLLITPVSFGIVTRLTDVRPLDILRTLAPIVSSVAAAFFAVVLVRIELADITMPLAVRTGCLGVSFVVVYVALVAILSRDSVLMIRELAMGLLRKKSAAGLP